MLRRTSSIMRSARAAVTPALARPAAVLAVPARSMGAAAHDSPEYVHLYKEMAIKAAVDPRVEGYSTEVAFTPGDPIGDRLGFAGMAGQLGKVLAIAGGLLLAGLWVKNYEVSKTNETRTKQIEQKMTAIPRATVNSLQ